MASATAAKEAERCIGCGKPLMEGRAFRILKGNIRRGVFYEEKEFGDLHEECFHEATDSPETVLRAVKRVAQKTDRKRSTKA